MIANLKPYPAYKDSGVPWLGQVPAHWEVRRLRNIVEMRVSNVDKHSKEGEKPVHLCNYVDVYKHERIRANMEFMKATASATEIKRFRLEQGDVLITKDSEAWDDIGVPALIESSAPDLISGYHIALLRPRQVVKGAFLLRALQNPQVAYQFHVEAKGVTRYGLSHDAIKSTSVPLPSLPEQAAIVRFLDYMERRMRRAMRARQKRITLLEEYKQALINEAVTGKIDVCTGKPYPAYKNSGVEWLGTVPEHWEVRRLGASVCACINGVWGSEPDGHHDLPCVRVADFDRVRRCVRVTHLTMRRITPSERIGRLLARGDLLLEKSGGGDQLPVGMVVLYDHDMTAVCSNFIARMPVAEGYDSAFLSYLHATLYAIQLNVRSIKQTTGIQNLDSKTYLAELIAFPPLPEQTAIVEYLDAQTVKLDAAIAATRRANELLREFRERLIADVVTGKVDVREVAAQLPEEPPEDEEVEEIDEETAMAETEDEILNEESDAEV